MNQYDSHKLYRVLSKLEHSNTEYEIYFDSSLLSVRMVFSRCILAYSINSAGKEFINYYNKDKKLVDATWSNKEIHELIDSCISEKF